MTTMRDGFTFIELLMVLVFGMVLLATVVETLTRQEEAYGLFNAVAATQQDTRMGMDMLSSELREVSAEGGDLLMATRDSMRIRALRKFGLICNTDKNNKRFHVANIGATPFAAGDSLLIYVDQDSLKAADDEWQIDYVQGTSSLALCGGTHVIATAMGLLLPDAKLQQITVPGSGLRFDSIFPGAPIRSFETLTYRVGTNGAYSYLQRVGQGGDAVPLLGPVDATRGLRLAYFDTLGTEITTYPLTATQRRSVGRIRVELRATRRAGAPGSTYSDSLISDIFLRGS